MKASAPSRTGAPVTAVDHPTPANLSVPVTANDRQSASCVDDRMLTQKAPAAAIFGQLVDDFAFSGESLNKLAAQHPDGFWVTEP